MDVHRKQQYDGLVKHEVAVREERRNANKKQPVGWERKNLRKNRQERGPHTFDETARERTHVPCQQKLAESGSLDGMGHWIRQNSVAQAKQKKGSRRLFESDKSDFEDCLGQRGNHIRTTCSIIVSDTESGSLTLSYVCPHCGLFPIEDFIWWVNEEHGETPCSIFVTLGWIRTSVNSQASEERKAHDRCRQSVGTKQTRIRQKRSERSGAIC